MSCIPSKTSILEIWKACGYSSKENVFYKLCRGFDSKTKCGVYTVSQLHDLPVYHVKYLKQALEKHYGNSIFNTNQEHRKDVVCFRN